MDHPDARYQNRCPRLQPGLRTVVGAESHRHLAGIAMTQDTQLSGLAAGRGGTHAVVDVGDLQPALQARLPRAVAAVRATRRQAKVVVVYGHWGTEWALSMTVSAMTPAACTIWSWAVFRAVVKLARSGSRPGWLSVASAMAVRKSW